MLMLEYSSNALVDHRYHLSIQLGSYHNKMLLSLVGLPVDHRAEVKFSEGSHSEHSCSRLCSSCPRFCPDGLAAIALFTKLKNACLMVVCSR